MDGELLSGLRVLDFTWMVAGPFATRLLADFGAEVIKVQSKRTSRGAESNLTGSFNTWNRNKRSITLDMGHPEAKEIVLKLAAKSDVLMENFSPRVMANWGLNYQVLKGVKPDLIMVSISAMGQSGPWKDFVAYAQTVHALSGLTYLTSLAPDDPLGLGFPYADHIAGLYAALAVLAALEHRDTTGEGRYIDLSAYEAACTLLGPTLLDLSLQGSDTLPQGNRPEHIPAAPYGSYPSLGRDRFCAIAVFSEEEWRALCQVMGNPAWAMEERFSCLSRRKKHARELDELLSRWTRQHPAEEVFQLLQNAGIAAGVVEDAADLAQDPHLKARNFFLPLEHPVLGKLLGDRTPIEFMDEPEPRPLRAAPLLGEDNRYVFMELLGLAESEYSACLQKGIIG